MSDLLLNSREPSRSESQNNAQAEQAKWDSYYASLPLYEDEGEGMRQLNAELVGQITALLPQGGRVLEAGSGGGWHSLALARQGTLNVTLTDFASEALGYARRLFEREKLDARLYQDDVLVPGQPDYDLVFNAGVLEHYTFEEQVQFLRGMASRSKKYVLTLVPNRACYWYWIWRTHKTSQRDWPFGKEVPQVDMSAVYQAAGLTFVGQTVMGTAWAETFIESLPGMDDELRHLILQLHHSPIIADVHKGYLLAALGSVDAEPSKVQGWSSTTAEVSFQQAELGSALADSLALNIAAERDLTRATLDVRDLTAQMVERNEAVRALSATLAVLEQQAQSLSAELSQKEQAAQVLTSRLADSEHTAQVLSARLSEKEQAAQALSVKLAEAERAAQALNAALSQKEQAAQVLVAQLARKEQVAQVLNVQLAEAEGAAKELREGLAAKEQTTRNLGALLTEKQQAAQALSLQLAEQEQLTQAMQVQLADRQKAALAIAAQLAKKTEALNAIHRSKHWKAMGLYWGLVDFVLTSYLNFRQWLREVIPDDTRRQVVRTYRQWTPPAGTTAQAPAPSAYSETEAFGLPVTTYHVICFPIINWDFRFQRPQQLMSQFAANGHPVHYIKTHFQLSSPEVIIHLIRDGITEIQLPGSPDISLYSDTLSALDVDKACQALEVYAHINQIVDAVCIVQLPFWAPIALRVKERLGWRMVYDCMDEHSGFANTSASMLAFEHDLIATSDLVVATSQALADKSSHLAKSFALVPNAGDFEHFNKASRRLADVPELSNIARPVIGYYGAIADWFDFNFLRAAAQRHPESSFVLIGSTEGADNHSDLRALPNVYFLGEKHYEELPAYLSHFDVACIPFKDTPLTQATNPVKFYEYLSAGKPVVASDLPELKPFQGYYYPAKSPEEFAAQLELAIKANTPDKITARINLARQHTWHQRYRDFSTSIAKLYGKAGIVIVSYNNLDRIRMCLDSIRLKTTYPNFEVIVVDNGSTPDVISYLKAAAAAWPQLKVVFNNTNTGFARANNAGIKTAGGCEYIVLLNNDTVVTRGWLSRIVHHLNNPQIGLVGPVTNFAGNEARINVNYTLIEDMEPFAATYTRQHFGERFDISMLAMYCLGMRRTLIDAIGMLDEQFGVGMFEDDDFSLRVRQAGYKLVCVEDVFIHHWGRASFNKLNPADYDRLFEANQKKFEAKWGQKWQPHQYRNS